MLDAVTKGYLALHPASAARTLSRLDRRDAAEALSAMPRQLAGKVLEAMTPSSAVRLLKVLPAPVASEILAQMALPAAAVALRLLEEKEARTLLKQLPRPKAARLRLRLRFSEWVIGALMEDDVLTLSPAHRIGDALRLLRNGATRPESTLPVVDSKQLLVGVVDLSELLNNADRRVISNIMRPASHVLSARAPLQTVIDHPAWLTHDSLPVINRNGVFLGVLRRSRVMAEEAHPETEIAERSELATTRAALADIFWLAVGTLFVESHKTQQGRAQDS